MNKQCTVALAGNPNSGKTTLFNLLTGSHQHIGNWPGVTVEKKSSRLKNNPDIIIQDLPGTYSLSAYSPEEVITRNFLINDKPEQIINVLDATNIERNLYFSLQLMETGVPIILALNMLDLLVKQRQYRIDTKKLSYLLNVPVVNISALKKKNINQLTKQVIANTDQPQTYPHPVYDKRLESALSMIEEQIDGIIEADQLRWYAIKLFERDEAVGHLKLTAQQQTEIDNIIDTAEKLFNDDSDSIVVNARYDYIERIINMCVVRTSDFSMSMSDRVDMVVTNRILALPIFIFVMWIVYFLSIQTIGTIGSDWVNDVLFGDFIPNSANAILTYLHVSVWLKSLIIDGLINGIGSVLGFLPQIMMLFLCLSILEDCGYMARIAFVMDRIFHRFNLSGKSFIPMLISTGCGVPGIMSTRTIESKSDRRMTIMLTTFMPCSAKLTVIALVSGTFFPENSWVAPTSYFISILTVVGSGIFLKKTKLFSEPPTPFVMELPAYHLPSIGNVSHSVWIKAHAFIKKAGTIIFASCVAIWFLSNFNFHFQMVDQNDSILRDIGMVIAPIFAPLGFGDWHATVAVIAGLIAKENCVSTLNITFGSSSTASFMSTLRQTYSPMAGYSFLVFNLLCAPCFAAIGAMYKEFGDALWTWRAVIYQTVVAYMCALSIFQVSEIIQGNVSVYFVALSFIAIGLMLYGIFIKRERPQQLELY